MDAVMVDGSDPVAVVTPAGRLDALSAPDLRTRCDRLIGSRTERLVLDLRAVEFLDSAGLAALVGALKRARAMGGDVKLVAPDHDGVRRILRLTRFEHVFDTAGSVAEAIHAFAARELHPMADR